MLKVSCFPAMSPPARRPNILAGGVNCCLIVIGRVELLEPQKVHRCFLSAVFEQKMLRKSWRVQVFRCFHPSETVEMVPFFLIIRWLNFVRPLKNMARQGKTPSFFAAKIVKAEFHSNVLTNLLTWRVFKWLKSARLFLFQKKLPKTLWSLNRFFKGGVNVFLPKFS